MKKNCKQKYYVFFRRELPLKPCVDIAHYIHDAQCANAAANLGLPAALVYCSKDWRDCLNLLRYIYPFMPKKPDKSLRDFYGIEEKLNIVPLPVPFGLDFGTVAYKYYLPLHILPKAKVVHTQDMLIAEAAVKSGVPVIYEQHYLQKSGFKKELVNNPLFRLAVVQSEVTKRTLVEHGMPEEKTAVMHNGFEAGFMIRKPDEAKEWRRELLESGQKYLAVYSGALFAFKGIDIIIEAAGKLPDVKFILTGGTPEQLEKYCAKVTGLGLKNVSFLGWITPRSRLFSLFQAADAMLNPELTKYGDYTDPVKFFQYLGSGTPIATTDLPFLEEFKNKGLAMGVCKPDSAGEFAGCLEAVLRDFPRKETGYAQNIEFARQFTWEKRMERVFARAGV